MKSTATPQDRSLLMAALVAAGFGVTGIAIAADYPATKNQTSPAATSPATNAATPGAAPRTGNVTAIAPNKAETPDSAFKKLDASGKGYLTMDDAKVLTDFDKLFQQFDANHDGRLTTAEFKGAWAAYSGNKG
jgi:Ca2+-binding EF-hand superfamily protein